MCPPLIKIPLRAMLGKQADSAARPLAKVWTLLSHFYLLPFLRTAERAELGEKAKQRILEFVDELVRNWGFTAELTYQSLQSNGKEHENEERRERVERVCSKLVQVN